MSYIQIEINGQKRGLNFNMQAIELMSQYSDVSETESGAAVVMIYCGLRGNSFVKREVLDLTFEQVCEYVEDLLLSDEGAETIASITKCFTDSKIYKFRMQSDEKKTSNGMKFTDSFGEKSESYPGTTTDLHLENTMQ